LLLILLFSQSSNALATITYVSKIGETGSGNGQFDYPVAIAIDSIGNIYVTDSQNSRIQKFTSNGTFVKKWGSEGTGDGEFGSSGSSKIILSIAVDSNDSIYVSDTFNHRIQKFTSDGTFVTKWGSKGNGNGEFGGSSNIGPYGMAIDSDDNIYVADPWNDRVQKFTSDGTFIKTIGSAGTGNGEFDFIVDVAVDSDDRLYVVDKVTSGYDDRVIIFTSDGTYLSHFGTDGTDDGEFTQMGAIGIDESNNIYVVDDDQTELNVARVQKFDTSGNYLDKFGSLGTGTGQFQMIGEVCPDNNGNLYVADMERDIIQKFNDDAFVARDSGNSEETSSLSQPEPPICNDTKPSSAPMIISLTPNYNKVEIKFTAAQNPVSYYSVAYGYDKSCSEFGIHNIGLGNQTEDNNISYTINKLSSGQTYYFKVRGGNGCMPGSWSEVKKINLSKETSVNERNLNDSIKNSEENGEHQSLKQTISETEIKQQENESITNDNKNEGSQQSFSANPIKGFFIRIINFFRKIF